MGKTNKLVVGSLVKVQMRCEVLRHISNFRRCVFLNVHKYTKYNDNFWICSAAPSKTFCANPSKIKRKKKVDGNHALNYEATDYAYTYFFKKNPCFAVH